MIKEFKSPDLEEVLRIEQEAFPKSPYSRFTFLYYAKTYPHNFLVFVEESSEKIIGYIIFYPDGHIASIAVSPRYRRKGIGRRLVEEVLRVTNGKAKVEVRKSNEVAMKFYEKIGFSFRYRIDKYYGDEDAVILTRENKNGFGREI